MYKENKYPRGNDRSRDRRFNNPRREQSAPAAALPDNVITYRTTAVFAQNTDGIFHRITFLSESESIILKNS